MPLGWLARLDAAIADGRNARRQDSAEALAAVLALPVAARIMAWRRVRKVLRDEDGERFLASFGTAAQGPPVDWAEVIRRVGREKVARWAAARQTGDLPLAVRLASDLMADARDDPVIVTLAGADWPRILADDEASWDAYAPDGLHEALRLARAFCDPAGGRAETAAALVAVPGWQRAIQWINTRRRCSNPEAEFLDPETVRRAAGRQTEKRS